MTTPFTIELTIHMPDGGRHARHLVNLYFDDMPDDINETAFNLCDANAAVQARKFARLSIKRSEAWTSPECALNVFTLLSVMGEDPNFIRQVFTKYMDGLPDYLRRASSKYFPHPGFPPDIPLQPTDWTIEVRQG